MREMRSYGSVRGATRESRPYRDRWTLPPLGTGPAKEGKVHSGLYLSCAKHSGATWVQHFVRKQG